MENTKDSTQGCTQRNQPNLEMDPSRSATEETSSVASSAYYSTITTQSGDLNPSTPSGATKTDMASLADHVAKIGIHSIPERARDVVYLYTPNEIELFSLIPDDFYHKSTRLYYVQKRQANGNRGFWGFTISIIKANVEFRFPVEGAMAPLVGTEHSLKKDEDGKYVIPGRGAYSANQIMEATVEALKNKGYFGWYTEGVLTATPKAKQWFNWNKYFSKDSAPTCTYLRTDNHHSIELMCDSILYSFKNCDKDVYHKLDGIAVCEWLRANVKSMTQEGRYRASEFCCEMVGSWRRAGVHATWGVMQRYGWPKSNEFPTPEARASAWHAYIGKKHSFGLAAKMNFNNHLAKKRARVLKKKSLELSETKAVLREDPLRESGEDDDGYETTNTAIHCATGDEEKIEAHVPTSLRHHQEVKAEEVPIIREPRPKFHKAVWQTVSKPWKKGSSSKPKSNIPPIVVTPPTQRAIATDVHSVMGYLTKLGQKAVELWRHEVSFLDAQSWTNKTQLEERTFHQDVFIIVASPLMALRRTDGGWLKACGKPQSQREP
ncbi:hypothetical protein [Neurospora intermedia fusarivirus 1]|uniref:Uncharacterized protein n=1 Tax=Neurospora intermedia fusarivirus 1 TaxID=2715688 RepID=A0A7G1GM39_9VIRU|nr:hypothetical protein [Neurospora intermedia fusarivirus 1]